MSFRDKCAMIPRLVDVLSTDQLDELRRELEDRDPEQRECSAAMASIEAEIAARFVAA